MKGYQIEYKITSNRQVVIPRGLGCEEYPDCFECPFPDCTYSESKSPRIANIILYTDGENYSEKPL